MTMQQPQAPKIAKKITQHGHERTDNYAWIRDDNWKQFIKGELNFADENVKTYLNQEAKYTEHVMSETKELQEQIYNELLSRTKEDDSSYPYQRNDYYYYRKTTEGLSYPTLCRKYKTLDAVEEVYFDINKEAEGKKLYMHRGAIPNEAKTHFAYCYNLTGSLDCTLKVRDFASQTDFEWKLEDVSSSFYWVDDTTIAFTELDEFTRGKNLYYMNIHEGPDKKKLVFSKPDKFENRFMFDTRTTNNEITFIYLVSGASHAIYKKNKNEQEFKLIADAKDDIQYSYEYNNGTYYILTNDMNNSNFAVYSCEEENIDKPDSWRVVIANSKNLFLRHMSLYGNKLVLSARNSETAIDDICVYDLTDKKMQTVPFAHEIKSVSLIGAHDHNATDLQVSFENPITAPQTLELDTNTLSLKVLKQKEVPNYNPENYVLKREFAKAHDGELIPLTIITRKGFTAHQEQNSAYVYAYGSYGYGMPPFFRTSMFSLIDRGFAYAVAHIRGGNEKGYDWYLNGKMRKKMNTFKDYISCCEHMVESGYTQKGQIVANGGSAGGLLMGAVTNMRPDLFQSVIADVPFVDVINTISDASLPLTPPEWEEWGNPIENKGDFEYMMQYSPYDNVEAKNYPAMLYNSGISDEQVTYWEPAKMVAKLRELKTDSNILLLNIKMHAGHAGETDRYKGLKEAAFNYAFALTMK